MTLLKEEIKIKCSKKVKQHHSFQRIGTRQSERLSDKIKKKKRAFLLDYFSFEGGYCKPSFNGSILSVCS